MISAVLMFGALNVLFEFVLLSMLAPRLRLRLLGSESAGNALHFSFLLMNLVIHWGTLVGTMSGVLAFVASMVTVRVARVVYGCVKEDRYYHVGWVKYSPDQVK